jgi:hypothetical protein
MATSPQEVDLVPGDEHTVSEHSKTPGIGGATTSSDTAISDQAISDTTISNIVISDTAISDTAIVDPVVTALAELQQMRGLHHSTFQALAALRMEISYHCGRATWYKRQPCVRQGRTVKPKQPVFVTLRGLSSDLLVRF